jgi:hypothetical protein
MIHELKVWPEYFQDLKDGLSVLEGAEPTMRCPFQMKQVQSLYSRNPPTFTTQTVHVECCGSECQAWDRERRECRMIPEKQREVADSE